MTRKPHGFTLIEIAIVLVVIGLLMGAVIRGSGELINNAKSKSLARDFENIPVYINAYSYEFNALPGDDARVLSHLAGATLCSPDQVGQCAVGNGIIDGKWSDTTTASESYLVWQHLRLAGYFPNGSTDTTNSNGDYIPRNVVGGQIGVTNSAASPIIGLSGSFIICSDAIPGKLVKRLETLMDDGNTATGSMRAIDFGTTTPGNAIQTVNIADDTLYLVCMSA